MTWGCSCGRVCDAGDRFCAACGAPRDKGMALGSSESKQAFLKRAEADDARALRGVRRLLQDQERSYRETENALERHAQADYDKFDGWFGEWLRGPSQRVDPWGFPVDDDWDSYDDFE